MVSATWSQSCDKHFPNHVGPFSLTHFSSAPLEWPAQPAQVLLLHLTLESPPLQAQHARQTLSVWERCSFPWSAWSLISAPECHLD